MTNLRSTHRSESLDGLIVRVAFTSMLIEITGSELVLINLHDTRCAGRGEVSRVGASHHDEVNVASMPGRPARHSDMAMTGSDISPIVSRGALTWLCERPCAQLETKTTFKAW